MCIIHQFFYWKPNFEFNFCKNIISVIKRKRQALGLMSEEKAKKERRVTQDDLGDSRREISLGSLF
jgi:hypothetical protein